MVGGQGSTYKDEATIWPTMWVPSAAYLKLAKAIRDEVSIAIFHATRITDAATADYAVKEGYLDMVGMTRALIADPHHVNKLREGRGAEIRPCVGAGYCVDRVISGHDALCVHNVATSREQSVPQIIGQSDEPGKKVIVAGGGPGGLEAARVSAMRGHRVVLFEASSELGGQMVLAAKATWRRGLGGIATWYGSELERLGVEVRLNRFAEAQDVLDEAPDVVVVATGGLPNVGHVDGADLVTTTWDLLSGAAAPGQDILLFDENGGHPGLSCAEVAASQGAKVEIVTPHKALGTELGGTNLGAHMSELYKLGVTVRPDSRLTAVARAGNKLTATVANTYSGGGRRRPGRSGGRRAWQPAQRGPLFRAQMAAMARLNLGRRVDLAVPPWRTAMLDAMRVCRL